MTAGHDDALFHFNEEWPDGPIGRVYAIDESGKPFTINMRYDENGQFSGFVPVNATIVSYGEYLKATGDAGRSSD